MYADFLCGSWILIALTHTLIALAHTLIALAHTLIALTHLNSTEKMRRLQWIDLEGDGSIGNTNYPPRPPTRAQDLLLNINITVLIIYRATPGKECASITH